MVSPYIEAFGKPTFVGLLESCKRPIFYRSFDNILLVLRCRMDIRISESNTNRLVFPITRPGVRIQIRLLDLVSNMIHMATWP